MHPPAPPRPDDPESSRPSPSAAAGRSDPAGRTDPTGGTAAAPADEAGRAAAAALADEAGRTAAADGSGAAALADEAGRTAAAGCTDPARRPDAPGRVDAAGRANAAGRTAAVGRAGAAGSADDGGHTGETDRTDAAGWAAAERRPVLGDRGAVALAVSVAFGALVGGGPARWVGVVAVVVALGWRRTVPLCLAGALLAAGLADAARAGLAPAPPADVAGWAVLVSDPEPLGTRSVRVDVDIGGRRYEAVAHGAAAGALGPRLAGERVHLTGRARPRPPDEPWLVRRRIVGLVAVAEVGAWEPGSTVARLANGYRRTIAEGATGLDGRTRGLLAGGVLGDDRELPPEVADDFRAVGLTHILVVSGSNVAFVLVLAEPVLGRLGRRARLPATLAVLGWFGLLTRFEPSVLRAATMAALAAVALTTGRPQATIRLLALAVTGLVLVDPLLVGSLGFGLSVGASAGIALLSTPIARALPGPRPVAGALAVTLAAQAGALPLLLLAFGSVPVATVPANLLAVPAAGPLMGWGMTAGYLAGLAGDPLRTVLHLPTRALAGWEATVAGRLAGAGLGQLGVLASIAAAAAVVAWVARHRWLTGALLAAVAVAAAASRPPPLPLGPTTLAEGVTARVVAGAVLVEVDEGAAVRTALGGAALAGVRCATAVVVRVDDPGPAAVAGALARRCPGTPILAAAGVARPGWLAVPLGRALAVGPFTIVASTTGDLQVGAPGVGSAADGGGARRSTDRPRLDGAGRGPP